MLKMFDESYYLSRYSDVRNAVANGVVADAETHYRQNGEKEGRQPNSIFDPKYYIANNKDLSSLPGLALEHFANYGAKELRNPSKFFDTGFYLSKYNDASVAAYRGTMTPADHFLTYGIKENRAGSPFFDPAAYLAANSDIKAAVTAGVTNAFTHFVSFGIAELRPWGNGLSASDFYNDTKFKNAIYNGLFGDAYARVAEVSPFFYKFVKPTDYTYASTLSIPTDFGPKDSTVKLVVPTGVAVGTTKLPAFIIDPSVALVVAEGDTLTSEAWGEIFSIPQTPAAVATITGFQSGSDKLSLTKSKFSKLVSAAGTLKAADLTVSATAVTPATSTVATALLFDGSTGTLYYNSDGATAAATTMLPLIVLTGISTLANTEVTVV